MKDNHVRSLYFKGLELVPMFLLSLERFIKMARAKISEMSFGLC